jgi:hypothetical protein
MDGSPWRSSTEYCTGAARLGPEVEDDALTRCPLEEISSPVQINNNTLQCAVNTPDSSSRFHHIDDRSPKEILHRPNSISQEQDRTK